MELVWVPSLGSIYALIIHKSLKQMPKHMEEAEGRQTM